MFLYKYTVCKDFDINVFSVSVIVFRLKTRTKPRLSSHLMKTARKLSINGESIP